MYHGESAGICYFSEGCYQGLLHAFLFPDMFGRSGVYSPC